MTTPVQKLSHASLQEAAHWYVQLQDEHAGPQVHTQWQHLSLIHI